MMPTSVAIVGGSLGGLYAGHLRDRPAASTSSLCSRIQRGGRILLRSECLIDGESAEL
jgi:hypothetical protein